MSSPLLWIPIAVLASALQTARNGLQRGLIDAAGPWGATLVRFLFGLPFSLAWLSVVVLWRGGAALHADAPAFWLACAVGAATQVLATAAVLQSMRASSFAVGTAFTHASLPSAALFGLAFGDTLHWLAWVGVALATAGLMVLSWPRSAGDRGAVAAALYGLFSGAAFGLSGNAFRAAALIVAPGEPALGGAATVTVVQAMQSAGLVAVLLASAPAQLRGALSAWRVSFGAGFFGAAASLCWFTALGMVPAVAVRAIGVIDMPMAALAGRRFFRERVTLRQALGATLTAAGVVLTAVMM